MRPLFVSVLVSAAAVLACTLVGRTEAQPPAQPSMNADTVAARVQAFYDQTQTVQATFHQTYFHKLYNRYDRSRGSVIFKKPGRMRWNYGQPNGKVIASDGSNIRVYEPPDEGETNGQGFEQAMDQSQLPAAFSFLTGSGRLADQFRFRLLPTQRHARDFAGYVLQLTPRQATPQYQYILFFVQMVGDPPAGIVKRVLIVDEAGNRNRFDFSAEQFNRPVPDSRFSYQFPRGTRIVQP